MGLGAHAPPDCVRHLAGNAIWWHPVWQNAKRDTLEVCPAIATCCAEVPRRRMRSLGAFGNADPESGGSFIGGFFMGMLSLAVLGLIICVYFLPSIVAYQGNKKNRSAIVVLNVFLGWTIIGWVVALVRANVKD